MKFIKAILSSVLLVVIFAVAGVILALAMPVVFGVCLVVIFMALVGIGFGVNIFKEGSDEKEKT